MTSPEIINKTVLMSGADFFSDEYAINPYMDSSIPVNTQTATTEHTAIKSALESAGVNVIQIPPPAECQDGVYTANWALCRGDIAVLSALPNTRQAESPYAEQILTEQGKKIVRLPEGIRFSGQGDALPCGNYLFVGSSYRTDVAAHSHLKQILGYDVVSLQTVPKRRFLGLGPVMTNKVTGWPDSYYYDIDLSLAVISPNLIAYCPEAFVPDSQEKLATLPIQKIIVSKHEAKNGFACNLVSTGKTVIMSARAPKLQAELTKLGLQTLTPDVRELGKGGGYIRCTTLTLDN